MAAAVPLVLYLPVNHFFFVNYDDDGYMNYHVHLGLSWENIKWAFGTFYYANWHPITWLGHMLDYQLFGLNAAGHHLSNLLLHCLNAVLLFLVLRNITRDQGRSFLVAMLFAVHPLNVESVAWISEKKNLLSTLFLFLAIGAYARYVRRPGVGRYSLVLVSFALGLMSKAMIVTLPFLFLLLDYWPLERFRLGRKTRDESLAASADAASPTGAERAVPQFSIGILLAEKIPLLVLSAADSVATVLAQNSVGAITDAQFGLPVRIENAAVSYVSYIVKMFWPVRLAIFYPHPGNSISTLKALVALSFLLAVTVIVISKRSQKYLVTGWLMYLGTLVPVIGLVQVGAQSMADRYAYIPLIGLFVMLVWAFGDLLERLPGSSTKTIAGAAIVPILLALAGDTRKQLTYWHDGVALFSHEVAVTPESYIGRSKLAQALEASGRLDEALAEFQSYQARHPNDGAANYNLAAALLRRGKTREAIKGFERTISLTQVPSVLAHTHWQLGNIFYSSGDLTAAEQHYRKAVELPSKEYGAHMMLGWILERRGSHGEAIPYLKESVQMETPDSAYFYLGQAYEHGGQLSNALAAYQQALKFAPQSQEIQSAINNIEQKSVQPQLR